MVKLIPVKPGRSRSISWTIAVILMVLWALGLLTSYTVGGFIHFLLLVAIAVVLINAITGRPPGASNSGHSINTDPKLNQR